MSSAHIIATGNVNLLLDSARDHLKRIHQLEDEINLEWEKAQQAAKGNLFNGTLCFYSGLTIDGESTNVNVFWGEYKHYVAQRQGIELGLTPVGVSGVIVAKEGNRNQVILGRRTQSVTQYPGALEFVPSGGVNADSETSSNIEPQRALLQEFEEETNISSDNVICVHPVCVIKDVIDNVVDICYLMPVRIAPEVIIKGIKASNEYDDAMSISLDQIDKFLT